jgi:hypothetical protein
MGFYTFVFFKKHPSLFFMKKYLFIALVTAAIFSFNHLQGQSFEKSGKYLNLNLGAAQMWHIGGDLDRDIYGFTGYAPITGQIGVQMEFGIHEYVGLGFTTGLGFGAGIGRYYYGGWYGRYYGYSPEVNIPIGMFANFHFYQLIADKVGKDIHADKLDIYAGLNVGSGAVFLFPEGTVFTSALFFIGPHAGVRYFFSDKVAVNAELGYGKSFFNGGLTFKLGK